MILRNLLSIAALLSGLADKHLKRQIEYLQEQNRVLEEYIHNQCGKKRICLTDNQRRRLAVKAKLIRHKALGEITDLFSPDTIIGWYCKLVAKKYDGSANREGGRPKVSQEIIDLVLQLARQNQTWGHGRIANYCKYLRRPVGKSTVRRIMLDHGLNPDPSYKSNGRWKEFIDSHLNVLAATDFFTTELLTPRGLVRCMVLFVIEYSTRRVHIAGIKANPDGEWMKQMARNLTDAEDGFLRDKRYFIHDRDPLFTKAFGETLEAVGVTPVKTVPRSPNMNPLCERWIQSIRVECLNRMILTSVEQLEYVVNEYVTWYTKERPHESFDGQMIDPWPQDPEGDIVCLERLGGLLKSYRRVKRAA